MFKLQIPVEVWREAGRDPALQRRFDEAVRREQNRYYAWKRESDRSQGVCVSGCGPDPWVGLTADQLLAQAKTALAETEAFRASPRGKVSAAMSGCADIATRINMFVGQVRAASDRSFDGELPRIDKLLHDLDGLRGELREQIRAAEDAIGDAYVAADDGRERSPLLLLAGEIVGANVFQLRGRG
jgi:hypothetical protein